MKRYRLLLVPMLLLFLGGGVFLLLKWDERIVLLCGEMYPLEVAISCQGAQVPESVYLEVMGGGRPDECPKEEVDYAKLRGISLAPFSDEVLIVHVPAERAVTSLLGRELRYNQYRTLLVVVGYRGGGRAGKVVTIPNGRETRRLSVSVAG